MSVFQTDTKHLETTSTKIEMPDIVQAYVLCVLSKIKSVGLTNPDRGVVFEHKIK